MTDIKENRIVWDRGTWRNPPVRVVSDGPHLQVTAAEESDAWRHTSYGFVHDSAHALLAPLGAEGAVEVSFCASPTRAGFTATFTRWVETDADASLHPEQG